MNRELMFSHKSDEWATPGEFFQKLDEEFKFTLDPCATDENHKAPKWYTIKDDGLAQSWGGERVFVNPPYSKIAEWVKKSYKEAQKEGTVVCLLIPARTDTRYFHEYILHRAEIRFIKGRLKFGESKNAAPFPSMLVIYRAGGV